MRPEPGETWLLSSFEFQDLTEVAGRAGLADVVERTSKPVGHPHDAIYPSDHHLVRLTPQEAAQLRKVFNPDA